MAKRKDSLFDDILTLTTQAPPWVGILLAVVLWITMHSLSLKEIPTSTGIEDMSSVLLATALKTLGAFGQLIFPVICLMGAAASWWRRRKGRDLAVRVEKHVAAVDSLNWQEFELMVSQMLRDQGFTVKDNLKPGPDGGVDQILKKDGKRHLVQCKHCATEAVGVSVVREMFGLMVAEGAHEVWVFTSGRYSQDAKKFARGKPIHLIDRTKLGYFAGNPADSDQFVSPPQCPICSATMKRRVAKRGDNRGQEFWGCSKFPNCRGTRQFI